MIDKQPGKGSDTMLIYLQMIETAADQSKFEAIYHEYRNLMFHVAFKRLQHIQDAEDAVHYAFVKIAENIKKIDPVSPRTKQYVVTIVDNRVTDLLRWRSKHEELPYDDTIRIATPSPLDRTDFLASCILKLPEQQRTVILLKYHHGYSLREIAKMLNISLFWAQKIDQRAKNLLRELYEEGGAEV